MNKFNKSIMNLQVKYMLMSQEVQELEDLAGWLAMMVEVTGPIQTTDEIKKLKTCIFGRLCIKKVLVVDYLHDQEMLITSLLLAVESNSKKVLIDMIESFIW